MKLEVAVPDEFGLEDYSFYPFTESYGSDSEAPDAIGEISALILEINPEENNYPILARINSLLSNQQPNASYSSLILDPVLDLLAIPDTPTVGTVLSIICRLLSLCSDIYRQLDSYLPRIVSLMRSPNFLQLSFFILSKVIYLEPYYAAKLATQTSLIRVLIYDIDAIENNPRVLKQLLYLISLVLPYNIPEEPCRKIVFLIDDYFTCLEFNPISLIPEDTYLYLHLLRAIYGHWNITSDQFHGMGVFYNMFKVSISQQNTIVFDALVALFNQMVLNKDDVTNIIGLLLETIEDPMLKRNSSLFLMTNLATLEEAEELTQRVLALRWEEGINNLSVKARELVFLIECNYAIASSKGLAHVDEIAEVIPMAQSNGFVEAFVQALSCTEEDTVRSADPEILQSALEEATTVCSESIADLATKMYEEL